jgi:hypothetical protein
VADWIVMTDDDCEPPPHWLSAHLSAQRATGCDATTGAMKLRAPPGAPRWLVEQPFYGDYEIRHEHLQLMEATGTNNMMIRSAWVRAHPDIRFLEQFGRCGGEDWIFFRMARKTGLTLRFSNDAWVIGNEPPERLTWRYQMLNRLWLGNSEYFVNSFTREAPQWVLIKRAWDRLPRALFNVIRNYSEPHYSLAVVARHTGYLLAIFGVRLRHH